MTRRLVSPVWILVLVGLGSASRAADWPMWRYDAKRSADSPQTLPGTMYEQWMRDFGPPDPAWLDQPWLVLDRRYEPVVAGSQIFAPSNATGAVYALDTGDGCEGLAFRIREEDVETETEVLFRREAIGPGYLATFVPVRIAGEDTSALTFLADHDYPDIRGDIARSEQVRCIATGAGFLGTSREYLANIVDHFGHLGIEDDHCTDLLREVDAYLAARAGQELAG